MHTKKDIYASENLLVLSCDVIIIKIVFSTENLPDIFQQRGENLQLTALLLLERHDCPALLRLCSSHISLALAFTLYNNSIAMAEASV